MKYVYGQGVTETKNYTKRVIIGAIALAMTAAMSLTLIMSAGAHQAVNIANEGKANCYGKMASLHAKDGGLKASYEQWNHVGAGLNGSETFQEEKAALKELCRAD